MGVVSKRWVWVVRGGVWGLASLILILQCI